MESLPREEHAACDVAEAGGEARRLRVQRRVARALAIDSDQERRFLQLLREGFVPGRLISCAAGTDSGAMLMDCFVQPVEDTLTGKIDGLPGIMEALGEAAESIRHGARIGIDFSRLRPKGAKVHGSDRGAAGPIAYMRVFDSVCDALEVAGSRDAAHVAVLRVDHPDIESFIDAKRIPCFDSVGVEASGVRPLANLTRGDQMSAPATRMALSSLRNFNITVAVTDAFMRAVIDDDLFHLVHQAAPAFDAATVLCADGMSRYVHGTVHARSLWERITASTCNGGGAGILCIDSANRVNELWYCERIEASTPCAQGLPPYGSCCQGKLDLASFVLEPFTAAARFEYEAFARASAGAVEFLDRTLDVTKWPLPQHAAEAAAKRRVQIGLFGLTEAVAMLGIPHPSPAWAAFAAQVRRALRDAVYRASAKLATKLGAFPVFDCEKYLAEGTQASELPQDVKDAIRQHGIRNSHLLAVQGRFRSDSADEHA
jgi:ribonucleoside-diphosphate reductase alpha chain